jgi:hypothetical protein
MTEDGIQPRRVRAGGLVILLCGAVLLWIGVFLYTGVMGQRLAMDGAGLAVLWLWATGAVAILLGGLMLGLGRRPRGLVWLIVGLIAVFVVTGLVVTLQSGGRMPRFYR